MVMTVKVVVNRSINPELYQMFINCIESIRQEHDVSAQLEISELMQKLYKVEVSPLTKLTDGTNVHFVEFRSEKDYAWFLLRWS